jgi:hypothetical protein
MFQQSTIVTKWDTPEKTPLFIMSRTTEETAPLVSKENTPKATYHSVKRLHTHERTTPLVKRWNPPK